MASKPIPASALFLGLAGLIPFYASAAFAFAADDLAQRMGLLSFSIYAAVILSFLGGARWGLELARAPDAPSTARLIYAVLPSIGGWALALAAAHGPNAAGLASGFAAAFAVQYVWDRDGGLRGLTPDWYPALRLRLTLGVILACFIVAWARIAGPG